MALCPPGDISLPQMWADSALKLKIRSAYSAKIDSNQLSSSAACGRVAAMLQDFDTHDTILRQPVPADSPSLTKIRFQNWRTPGFAFRTFSLLADDFCIDQVHRGTTL